MYRIQSYLHDLLKLFLQYLAVGFCAIPATVVYFTLLNTAHNSGLAMAGSLVAGFALAYLAWRWVDQVLNPRQHLQPKVIRFEPMVTAYDPLPAQAISVAGTLTFAVVVVAGGHVVAVNKPSPRSVCFPSQIGTATSNNILVG